jgi:hypothetical protein
MADIDRDSKAIAAAIEPHKRAAQARHKLWTTFEAFFADPFAAARRAVKVKVIAWQEEQRERAEAEQRRLQAEADEAARLAAEQAEADEAARLAAEQGQA